MSVITYEGIVEDGRVRLKGDAKLPEHATVYVVVPDSALRLVSRIASPRLLRPEQAADFELEVGEEEPDAGL